MVQIIRVSAGILTRPSQLLICQRRAGDVHALKWEFPGGKLENGENEAACLRRELQEELGIQASISTELYRASHTYLTGRSVALTFFHVPAFQGQLVNRVFKTLVWVEPAQLRQYDFLEGNVEFVTSLAQGHWNSLFSMQ